MYKITFSIIQKVHPSVWGRLFLFPVTCVEIKILVSELIKMESYICHNFIFTQNTTIYVQNNILSYIKGTPICLGQTVLIPNDLQGNIFLQFLVLKNIIPFQAVNCSTLEQTFLQPLHPCYVFYFFPAASLLW